MPTEKPLSSPMEDPDLFDPKEAERLRRDRFSTPLEGIKIVSLPADYTGPLRPGMRLGDLPADAPHPDTIPDPEDY